MDEAAVKAVIGVPVNITLGSTIGPGRPADVLFPLVPIRRQAVDVCVIGKKSRGKSFILAINGFIAYLSGKMVFSNMYLGYPHVEVKSLEDVVKMSEYSGKKCFIGDDLENWVSSKFIDNKSKASILEFTLNAAKYECDLWWSAKRPMEIDKTLRSGVDYFMECSMELKDPVSTIEEFDEKVKYLNNCRIRVDIYDGDGFGLRTEYYYDLDIWKDLFSTTERIGHLEK